MKIKSVSGFTCYVKSLSKTAKFYESLGFEVKKREPDHLTVYSNWFWIDFIAADREKRAGYVEHAGADRAGGLLPYLSVDNVDEFYKNLRSQGIKPASEPQDTAFGNREFMIHDPDGYSLVIFKRK